MTIMMLLVSFHSLFFVANPSVATIVMVVVVRDVLITFTVSFSFRNSLRNSDDPTGTQISGCQNDRRGTDFNRTIYNAVVFVIAINTLFKLSDAFFL